LVAVRIEVKDFTDGRYTKDIVSVFEGVVADFSELDGLYDVIGLLLIFDREQRESGEYIVKTLEYLGLPTISQDKLQNQVKYWIFSKRCGRKAVVSVEVDSFVEKELSDVRFIFRHECGHLRLPEVEKELLNSIFVQLFERYGMIISLYWRVFAPRIINVHEDFLVDSFLVKRWSEDLIRVYYHESKCDMEKVGEVLRNIVPEYRKCFLVESSLLVTRRLFVLRKCPKKLQKINMFMETVNNYKRQLESYRELSCKYLGQELPDFLVWMRPNDFMNLRKLCFKFFKLIITT